MSATILLADDSLTIQKVVELTFADTEHGVVAVSSGDELLDRLDGVRPDLIICDVIMPGTDGYQVCQAVKSRPDTLHIPVVLLTGTFEPFDRDRALAAGADDIITKPFEARKLVETVESLLSRSSAAPVPAAGDAGMSFEGEVLPPPYVGPEGEGLDFTTTGFAEMRAAGEAQMAPPTEIPKEGLEVAAAAPPPAVEEAPEEAPEEPVTPPPLPVSGPYGTEVATAAPEEFEATTEALEQPEEAAPEAPEEGAEGAPETAGEPPFAGDTQEADEGEVEPAAMEQEPPPFGAAEPEEAAAEEAEPAPEPAGFEEPEEAAEAGVAEDEEELAAAEEVEETTQVEEAEAVEEAEEEEEAEEVMPPYEPEVAAAATAPEGVDEYEETEEAEVAEEPQVAEEPEIAEEPEPEAPPMAAAPAVAAAAPDGAPSELSDADVDRIARRVLELASSNLERIAWEVIPDMAELVVRERLRQLEVEVEEEHTDAPQ